MPLVILVSLVWEGSFEIVRTIPTGFCYVNKVEMEGTKVGLFEAHHWNLWCILVLGHSLCARRWAYNLCRAPCSIADAAKELMDLAKVLEVSFAHIKRIANLAADLLA